MTFFLTHITGDLVFQLISGNYTLLTVAARALRPKLHGVQTGVCTREFPQRETVKWERVQERNQATLTHMNGQAPSTQQKIMVGFEG